MHPVGFNKHDHLKCVSSCLTMAERKCLADNLKLTPVRRRVLEILLTAHKAVGAYEILDILQAEGGKAQPPVAYRALEFLVRNGFAHRIERLNAFVACTHPHESHIPAFLICRLCDQVAETAAPKTSGLLGQAAEAADFELEQAVIEAEGLCPACRKEQ